jgi:hypothetical protein
LPVEVTKAVVVTEAGVAWVGGRLWALDSLILGPQNFLDGERLCSNKEIEGITDWRLPTWIELIAVSKTSDLLARRQAPLWTSTPASDDEHGVAFDPASLAQVEQRRWRTASVVCVSGE